MARLRVTRPTMLLLLALAVSTSALAQKSPQNPDTDFPKRPVRIVVGTEPGAAPDILARIVAEKLTEQWGQQAVVDNRPGAAAVLGAEIVSRAQPDGHTLFLSAAIHVVTPNVQPKLPYHAINSFTPIARIASSPFVLIVAPNLRISNVQELIEYAKANPGKLNFSSPGNGSIQHLSGEILKQRTAARMTHVPYKSGSASVTAILTGDVQFCFVGLPPALPFVRAGRVRALAVTTDSCFPSAPEIPTAQEAGLAGFEADNWHAVMGPAATPKSLVGQLNASIVKVLSRADVQDRMLNSGAVAKPSSPEVLLQLMRAEYDKWAAASRAAGVKPER